MQSRPTTGSDDDRDDGGPSSGSSDVFFQNDFQTQLPSYSAPAPQATTQQRADAFTQSKLSSFNPSEPEKFYGGFYVGGVPTKPMKPQRLKKGGLAKPKVKPKRMKKGGLASRKK